MGVYLLIKRFFILFLFLFLFSPFSWADEIVPLSLQDCIKEALEKNPAIKSAEMRVEQAMARVKIASSQPNPVITVSATKGDPTEEANSIKQGLEIFGQTNLKKTEAQCEFDAISCQYDEKVLDITSQVKSEYYNFLLQEEFLQIIKENVITAESILRTVERRYELGDIPQVQLIKANVELTRAQQELASQERELYLAEACLNTLLGRNTENSILLENAVFVLVEIPGIEEIKQIAIKSSPVILAEEFKVDAAKARIKIASLYFLPQAQLSYYKSSFEPSGTNGAQFSLAFPIFDWGQSKGKIDEAKASLLEQEGELQGIKNAVLLEIDGYFLKVREAEKNIKSFQKGVLGESERLLDMNRKGYERGALTLLEVLEAQRTLKAVKMEYRQLLVNYQIALAQLERVVGREIIISGDGK